MIERRRFPRMLFSAMVAKIGLNKVPVRNISETGIAVLWPSNDLPKQDEELSVEFKFNNSSICKKAKVKRIWAQSVGLQFNEGLELLKPDVVLFGESLKEISEDLGFNFNFRWYKGLRDLDLYVERNEDGSYKRIEFSQEDRVLSFDDDFGLRSGTIKGYENDAQSDSYEIRAVEYDNELDQKYCNYARSVLSQSQIADREMIVSFLIK